MPRAVFLDKARPRHIAYRQFLNGRGAGGQQYGAKDEQQGAQLPGP